MANDGPSKCAPKHTKGRRLPNELLAELCRSVVPLVGIWDGAQRPPAATPPRRTSALLTVSASMYAYLWHKFRVRKATEMEQREKCCQICAQLAWGSCRVGPNKKICIGCKCFFLRCLRDKGFAEGGVCTCGVNEGMDGEQPPVPRMCKPCRLSKCRQIEMESTQMLPMIAVGDSKKRRTMGQ